jgi:hypothetical protein
VSYLLRSFAMAPIAMAWSMQWPLNPVIVFICVFLVSIGIAVPVAGIAALVRWGMRAEVEFSARQRLVDAAIAMVATSGVLGWAIFAFVVSGAGSNLRGLKYDSFFIVLVFVPPVLALASGVMALVQGQRASRGPLRIPSYFPGQRSCCFRGDAEQQRTDAELLTPPRCRWSSSRAESKPLTCSRLSSQKWATF